MTTPEFVNWEDELEKLYIRFDRETADLIQPQIFVLGSDSHTLTKPSQ